MGNTVIQFMQFIHNEAESLLEEAKQYRVEMELLPGDDPRREIYTKAICTLLNHSSKLCFYVIDLARN